MNNYIKGKVYLVGAGPGDPDLITVRGAKVLGDADVILYDRLANPELLALASATSEHIFVGKKPGVPSVSQSQVNRLMIQYARKGCTVARLKGGDPFIFGRGGEECEALRAENIPYEVIPGISSALAAPAYAGIPLTHRGYGRSITIVTGHTVSSDGNFEQWEHLARVDTLVILMGMRMLPSIANKLIQLNRSPDTPAAVVSRATFASQQTVIATLSTIAASAAELPSPGTIVVGELAAFGHDLAWFPGEPAVSLERKSEIATKCTV